jgi:hypothetical protein
VYIYPVCLSLFLESNSTQYDTNIHHPTITMHNISSTNNTPTAPPAAPPAAPQHLQHKRLSIQTIERLCYSNAMPLNNYAG